ncbi:hypothetical protein E1B28_011277 [Marasmius oreades]|uniref:DUF1690-domain-containing protein n=1 Tax=Marasmius oreades TaxID=181124 RepID=A0A9P7UR14_9AGAR|nr:uncharacterized protein E1B28_011277 [Marasmius oreades]KAG7089611.1 hypothetical protein E1B28_011277 [Marasmius oreades]
MIALYHSTRGQTPSVRSLADKFGPEMGAAQSTTGSEKVFRNETPIQFSPDVVDQLQDREASPGPTPERQTTIDQHIRSRIEHEVKQLRKQEEEVQNSIALALEKENLDKEKSMGGEVEGGDSAGAVKSSAALFGDLEDIRSKIERFQTRRTLQDHPEVKSYQEAVLTCYKSHPVTTLDCWQEVNKFKESVRALEQGYFKSLH